MAMLPHGACTLDPGVVYRWCREASGQPLGVMTRANVVTTTAEGVGFEPTRTEWAPP
jgi:hypothetical protein